MQAYRIVTFPSFHAATAALFSLGVLAGALVPPGRGRGERRNAAGDAAWAAGTIFIDVFAGIAVAAAAIIAAQWIAGLLARPAPQPVATSYRQEAILPAGISLARLCLLPEADCQAACCSAQSTSKRTAAGAP